MDKVVSMKSLAAVILMLALPFIIIGVFIYAVIYQLIVELGWRDDTRRQRKIVR